jgi:hypothetical protein
MIQAIMIQIITRKTQTVGVSIGNDGREIRVVTYWIKNIYNYGRACKSDKNGIMNFAEHN